MLIRVNNRVSIDPAELSESFIRSSGPGGQNVNKVASKAVLRWAMAVSPSVPADVKERLKTAHPAHITNDGEFLITSQTYRDQERNREACLEKLTAMLRKAAVPPIPRKKTKPSKSSNRRRLADKKHNADRKTQRRTGGDD